MGVIQQGPLACICGSCRTLGDRELPLLADSGHSTCNRCTLSAVYSFYSANMRRMSFTCERLWPDRSVRLTARELIFLNIEGSYTYTLMQCQVRALKTQARSARAELLRRLWHCAVHECSLALVRITAFPAAFHSKERNFVNKTYAELASP